MNNKNELSEQAEKILGYNQGTGFIKCEKRKRHFYFWYTAGHPDEVNSFNYNMSSIGAFQLKSSKEWKLKDVGGLKQSIICSYLDKCEGRIGEYIRSGFYELKASEINKFIRKNFDPNFQGINQSKIKEWYAAFDEHGNIKGV